jgi:hypothetical protein
VYNTNQTQRSFIYLFGVKGDGSQISMVKLGSFWFGIKNFQKLNPRSFQLVLSTSIIYRNFLEFFWELVRDKLNISHNLWQLRVHRLGVSNVLGIKYFIKIICNMTWTLSIFNEQTDVVIFYDINRSSEERNVVACYNLQY